jgi:hypothetical protein
MWFYGPFFCIMAMVFFTYVIIDLVKPTLITQSPEWKQAEKEMLIREKQNPFTGVYAEHLKEK